MLASDMDAMGVLRQPRRSKNDGKRWRLEMLWYQEWRPVLNQLSSGGTESLKDGFCVTDV